MSARTLERDLARVVALTVGAARAPRTSPAASGPRAPTTRIERARGELTRVQRAELALLLRRAAALRLEGAEGPPPDLADGLREALALAAVEGWRWPRALARLARCLVERPCERWPSALHLARAARALAPCLAARVLLADALAASGAPRAALGELAGALANLPRGALPQRLTRALRRHLERAAQARGDARLARACARLASTLAAERVA